jgi:hypothetical protein
MGIDHWDISNLIARYAELLNLGRIEELGELFRYGTITSVGNPTTYTGTDEVVAMYRDSVHLPEKVPDTLIVTTNLQDRGRWRRGHEPRLLPRGASFSRRLNPGRPRRCNAPSAPVV